MVALGVRKRDDLLIPLPSFLRKKKKEPELTRDELNIKFEKEHRVLVEKYRINGSDKELRVGSRHNVIMENLIKLAGDKKEPFRLVVGWMSDEFYAPFVGDIKDAIENGSEVKVLVMEPLTKNSKFLDQIIRSGGYVLQSKKDIMEDLSIEDHFRPIQITVGDSGYFIHEGPLSLKYGRCSFNDKFMTKPFNKLFEHYEQTIKEYGGRVLSRRT